MSVWMGFAKAQGVGKKVALIKTLVEADDISSTIIQGTPSGMVATIDELVKVDFATLQILSSVAGNASGGTKVMVPNVLNYSANTFAFQFLSVNSGIASTALGAMAASGDNFSGIITLRAFIVGEPKRAVIE